MTKTFTKAQDFFGLLLSSALDLLFPAACSGCGRVDTGWCWHCQRELNVVPITLYSRTETLVATGLHTGILQHAVHALKYDNLPQLAHPLAARLSQVYTTLAWSVDLVTPVPSHTQRLRERGYNQAQLIAESFAHNSQLPCLPHVIQRVRDTRSQVGLNHKERRVNVADAFYASQVEGKTVLLVDDVLTTGATLDSCAQALLKAGASRVYGLTVTVAVAQLPRVGA